MWFIKTKLLWDSLKAKKRLQLLSVGLGSGRVPRGLSALSLGFGFSQSLRLVMGCPLGALLQGVCLLQLCLFLSPCCSAEPLGELSISHLVLLSPDPSCGCRRRKSSEVHLNSQSLNFLSYQTIFALCSLRKHLK